MLLSGCVTAGICYLTRGYVTEVICYRGEILSSGDLNEGLFKRRPREVKNEERGQDTTRRAWFPQNRVTQTFVHGAVCGQTCMRHLQFCGNLDQKSHASSMNVQRGLRTRVPHRPM